MICPVMTIDRGWVFSAEVAGAGSLRHHVIRQNLRMLGGLPIPDIQLAQLKRFLTFDTLVKYL